MGFECFSFSDMSKDIENQLKKSHYSDFRNFLDPSCYFDVDGYGLDRDYSTILAKDGKLRAYILVSKLLPGCLFIEQVAESFSDIGSGIIAYPDLVFNDKIFNRKEIKTLHYTISVKNERSIGYVDSVSSVFPKTITDVISFVG